MRQQLMKASESLGDQANVMAHQQQQPDEQHIGRGSKRRPLEHYDQLIGAIDQGTSSTRFLVFEKGTGRLVASSQLEIKRITPREGWVEIDPNVIMSSVYATMANVHDQLLAKLNQLNLEPSQQVPSFLMNNSAGAGANFELSSTQMLLKCIGICNQRESAVVWDSKTGQPLYNVIVWMDNRTKDIVDSMIDSIPGRDFNHLKDKTGLPMSTYFSAFKLRWLIDNVPEVQAALQEKRLLVGTVDSWILWNLTGKHLTDVTNASRTFLMNIETLKWDKSLCKQFKVPMEILPNILSSADDFGRLQFGPFMGTPVTGVIGDQSAALFGHNCLQLGQTKATFGTGCFIMQNIGPGPLNGALSGVQREAKRGLITTVGYKLKNEPVSYALEGSIKIAGAALTWLRDNMQLIENYEECDQLVNKTTNSAGVFFVPALGGLYSPYWDPNAAGLFIGLSQFTRREHLVRATFDSIAFQTNDILSLMHGVANGLMIDGGLCKSDNLCQILADITGCDIVRPSMCETSALGAAMVAGYGAGIWDHESMMAHSNTSHEYACSTFQTHHYPQESLSYDESKFSHSSSQAKSRCYSNLSETHLNGTKKADDHQQEIQQQPIKQHRRSLRHRNGGRLMRNLDAGGGINDDAGGGDDGGGGGGATAELLHHTDSSLDDNDNDNEDEDNFSSAGHLAGSDTDFESGHVVESSSLPSNDYVDICESNNIKLNTACREENHHQIESSYESSQADTTSQLSEEVKERTKTNLFNNMGYRQGAPSSSGYSSGDNLELVSNQLMDSIRLLSCDGRVDSPISQSTSGDILTISGRDSVGTCTEDFSGNPNTIDVIKRSSDNFTIPNAKSCDQSSTRTIECSAKFPYDLNNIAHELPIVAPSQQQVVDRLISEKQTSDSINGSNCTLISTTVDPVQQVNNRKFAETAEDVADEVHEFGGRDSYGEDGYDSSTVSFDSYEDNDDVDDPDQLEVIRSDLVEYRADEIDPYRDSQILIEETKSMLVNQQHDVIDKKATANLETGVIAHHQHRRRQASLIERQMDVFQPYISLEHRTELVDTWRIAVTRSMRWTKVHHEEIRRINYQRLSSLPFSMYAFFSIGLVALSSCLSSVTPMS